METIIIAKVRKIAKDANGNTINLVVIDLANGKPSIVRSNTQFLQDLKNSYLVDESVNTVNHPQVLEVLRDIRRGTVSGNISYHKKGEMWAITKDSRAITDPKHPQFGKVSVGDTLPYENDNTRVEDGFLDFVLPNDARTIRANASALASGTLALAGGFDVSDSMSASNASTVTGVTTQDAFDIPDNVMQEIVGSAKEEPKAPKVK